MSYWSLLDCLVRCLNLVLRYHPAGLRVLLGQAKPPDMEEICRMLESSSTREELGVRVNSGARIPFAERCLEVEELFCATIEKSGGWKHIAACFREFQEQCPQDWDLFRDHVMWVRPGGIFRLGTGMLARLAEKHGVSEDTIQRRRHEVVEQVARLILMETPEGGIRLIS